MTTSTIVLIVVVAVVAILLIAAIAWVARNKRNQHRHVVADKIREAARRKPCKLSSAKHWPTRPRAKARAAQAEADVKAAQASGLQQPSRRPPQRSSDLPRPAQRAVGPRGHNGSGHADTETPRPADRKEHQDH